MEVVNDGTTFFRGQFLGCASGRYRNWSDCEWQSRLICCDHYTCFRSVSDARSPVPYYCPEVIKINQSSITTLGLSGHQSGSWQRCVWSFIITNVSKYYSKWSSSIFYLIFSIFRNPLQPQLFFTTSTFWKILFKLQSPFAMCGRDLLYHLHPFNDTFSNLHTYPQSSAVGVQLTRPAVKFRNSYNLKCEFWNIASVSVRIEDYIAPHLCRR